MTATVLCRVPRLSRAKGAHLQLVISAAFGSQGAITLWSGATNSQLPFSWPFFLISRHVWLSAAEPVLNSAFSVFQELHNQNVHRTIALCLDTLFQL